MAPRKLVMASEVPQNIPDVEKVLGVPQNTVPPNTCATNHPRCHTAPPKLEKVSGVPQNSPSVRIDATGSQNTGLEKD